MIRLNYSVLPVALKPALKRIRLAGRYKPCWISSSRDHSILMGLPGMALAIETAWRVKSCGLLRPRPPPNCMGCTFTLACGTPAVAAATAKVDSGFCVEHHTSSCSPCNQAVQTMGSIHGAFFGAVFLIVMPVSGFLATNAHGFPLKWFGLFTVWSPIGKSPDIAGTLSFIHEWSAWILLALFALHFAAVVFHHVIRRDGTLYRIL